MRRYRDITCSSCGTTVTPTRGGQLRCPPCGKREHTRKGTLRRAELRGAVVGLVICADCGKAVPRKGPSHVRCEPCSAERSRVLHLQRVMRRHYRVVGTDDYRERCRAATRRRRARKRAGRCEKYSEADVLRQSGGACALCGIVIDLTLPSPHPMSFTVDHVLPLFLGGADALDNVQAAHRTCNTRRGWRGFLILDGAA